METLTINIGTVELIRRVKSSVDCGDSCVSDFAYTVRISNGDEYNEGNEHDSSGAAFESALLTAFIEKNK